MNSDLGKSEKPPSRCLFGNGLIAIPKAVRPRAQLVSVGIASVDWKLLEIPLGRRWLFLTPVFNIDGSGDGAMTRGHWLGINDRRGARVFAATLVVVSLLITFSLAMHSTSALDLAGLASFAGYYYFASSRGLSVFQRSGEIYQSLREGRAVRASHAENVLSLIAIVLIGIVMYVSFIAPFV